MRGSILGSSNKIIVVQRALFSSSDYREKFLIETDELDHLLK